MEQELNGFQDIIVNVIDGIVVGVVLSAFRTIPSIGSYFLLIDICFLIGFIMF